MGLPICCGWDGSSRCTPNRFENSQWLAEPVASDDRVVDRVAETAFLNTHCSMLKELSWSKSDPAHTTCRDVSALISKSPKPSVKSACGLLAKQAVSHAQAESCMRALSIKNLIDGALIVTLFISPVTSVGSTRHDSTVEDISGGMMKPDDPNENDVRLFFSVTSSRDMSPWRKRLRSAAMSSDTTPPQVTQSEDGYKVRWSTSDHAAQTLEVAGNFQPNSFTAITASVRLVTFSALRISVT